MESQVLSPSVVAEFQRLRSRFEDLSARQPPLGMCFLKTHNDFEDVIVHPSGLHCVPPPEPWLSFVDKRCFEAQEVEWPDGPCHQVITRTLIFNLNRSDWSWLAVSAAHASHLLRFVPRWVWPQVSTYWTTTSRTENGWRWFNTVFDLALGPPNPKLLSVDNSDRGGFFWWHDSQSKLAYVGDYSTAMDFIKRDGRYGAVISDMAMQSALAVSLILELAGVETASVSDAASATQTALQNGLQRYSAEQKAWYWYQWICRQQKKDLDGQLAFELLKELATTKEPHHCPPWTDRAEWPAFDIEPETFRKYLSRQRRKSELPLRSIDAGSIVRISQKQGKGGHDLRAMTPAPPLAKHPRAAQLRAAASDQAARDAEAALHGFDIEPPIDSQGDPT